MAGGFKTGHTEQGRRFNLFSDMDKKGRNIYIFCLLRFCLFSIINICAKKPHLRLKEGGEEGMAFQDPGAHKRSRIYAERTMCLVSYVSDRLVLRHRGQRRTPTIGLPAAPVETPANAGIQVLLFESTGRDAPRSLLMPACARLVAEFRQVSRGSGGQAWWSVDSGGDSQSRGSARLRLSQSPELPSSADGVVTIGGSTFKATSVE